jgi:LPXTG-site transpeptidase (sortase) family protein
MAVLRVPKIGLEVPLLEGTDDLTLNHAVGRIAGTARPGEAGNIGIAGHRDGFFRGLKDVAVGDAIELQTPKGTDKYIVDQIQIVKPNQVEVLKQRSVRSLTLVTCYPFYFLGSAPRRYIVTASLSRETNGEAGNLNLSSPSTANNPTRRAKAAFLAGVSISGLPELHDAHTQLVPLRDALVALFFVSLGTLVDPKALVHSPPLLGFMLLLIVGGKFLVWTSIVWLFRYPSGQPSR